MCEIVEIIDELLVALNVKQFDIVLKHIRNLRNYCARGKEQQKSIITNIHLQNFINNLLFQHIYDEFEENKLMKTITWQLLANSIVQNDETQKILWLNYGESIEAICGQSPLNADTNLQLMIIFTLHTQNKNIISDINVLHLILKTWQNILEEKSNLSLQYLHFIYENFIVTNGHSTAKCYSKLNITERLIFLNYITQYIRDDSPNGIINKILLNFLCMDFKMKSDCLLKHTTQIEKDEMKPKEVYGLLSFIACASGSERYGNILNADHSLFLNASTMLRCLIAVGKEVEKNMYTPLDRLEDVARASNVSRAYENEISYELKTLLVRCIANLLYQNKKNQEYCYDTQLMQALFECTNLDARNPLMREWSILAIRNACIGCPENQSIIANLTKEGDAKNDLLNELNLEMGSLRIKSNVD